MRVSSRMLIWVLITFLLAGCGSLAENDLPEPTSTSKATETPEATVQPTQPTDTPTATETTEPTILPTEQASPSPSEAVDQGSGRPIVYWRFLWLESGLPEDDMIEVFPQAVLDRTVSDLFAGDDPAENIRMALQLILDHPEDRLWETENMAIQDVQVSGSAATIDLTGDIMVFGGGVAAGTKMQFVLTIFEEPGIETALIRLNADNFVNLIIDHPSEVRPEDFVYTRAYYDELIGD